LKGLFHLFIIKRHSKLITRFFNVIPNMYGAFGITVYSIVVLLLFATGTNGQALRFEAIPLENPDFMYREFRPFLDSLSASTGLEFELVVPPEYRQTIADIAKGKVDLAFLSGTTFLLANKKATFHVIAEVQFERNPHYHSVIITRDDSEIHKITDLKGKTFAFGSPLSTSSTLYPKYMILKAGLCLNDLSKRVYLKHHNRVVLSVLNGRYNAGSVRKKIADKYKKFGLRYLSISESISNFCIAYNNSLDRKLVRKIQKALLGMRIKNSYFDYFYPANDSLYDAVKKIKQFVDERENKH